MLAEQLLDQAPLGSRIVGQIRDRYGIGSRFAHSYLDYWCKTRNANPASLDEIFALPEPEPMWFDYALRTNLRGAKLRDSLSTHLRPWYMRYLDVGCGFGGCLVAFSKAGLQVSGIELDPLRAEFSKANLLDHNIPPNVLALDILAPEARETLGRYDLITCIDVIEHVLDVPKTLEILCSLLTPGGLLVLEIPNKNFIPFVSKDGHFSLFGITQLPRPEAIAYHKQFFDFEYDVGDYYELGYYFELLRKNRCEPMLTESSSHKPRDVSLIEPFLNELSVEREAFLKNTASKLDRSLAKLIVDNCDQFSERAKREYRSCTTPAELETYQDKFLNDFWTVAARKID